ncbi:NmrA family NAD(P)-binding protein [Nonomuraea gerenzanensis]|uniref:Oxidoreductase n=1 Tax=Nonomuraea gerenzanensis TaxID=93944 RepID=A0A1M4EAI2_9ACTN|nr:NAD(P)H-binding protein [Nonomuraea gerenzanensis]UBU18130.1 NAD(P)H-binding protein [Nonomuraea gerenzanensis]SBO95939.1 Oxidoreductase [Nonomuraea gerenzanensis]
MTILVTGATGTVGRRIVGQLVERGVPVRALTRNPGRAALPDGVEVACGDLTSPGTLAPALEGVTGLHLITFGGDDCTPLENGAELVRLAAKAGVQRVSVLSSWDETSVEEALRAGELGWTQLQCVEFMANAFEWAEPIRQEGVVRVFGNHPGAVVHEADIAAVAVAALVEEGHAGETYLLTGPEALTPEQRVRMIGAAAGREIRFEELSEQEYRAAMRAAGVGDDLIEFGVQLGANPPDAASVVLPTVERVTGRPGHTFAQWAAEHAAAFRI